MIPESKAYPGVAKKGTVTSIKKQLNKFDGWSRDGSTKNYPNKGSRDNEIIAFHWNTITWKAVEM